MQDDSLIRNDFCNQDVNAQPRVQGAADMGAMSLLPVSV